ncbi:hypothetical protein ES677_04670 [Bizionia gelidisalsuginis]|uniref:Polysaccharide chain length determinant N-terminal domain-containing protein n=1 Tax=Bizionia gelidisalsuginis TaxID=291188 RepID=A0ABY3MCK9_9FLAO|nr:DUF2273 domain-containing protein [Bizionia gelidisalsuginis]TYC15639.1 hypothetical protein ES677_04670 [Bizionia gelidisalsuginis]
MSEIDKQDPKSNTEEVDLVVFFNLIGNAFTRLFNFIGRILKSILSFIISILKVIISFWKPVFIILIVFAGLGYMLERTNKPIYSSEMLVEPYFGSKYQLVSNINYFNALIANKDYNALNTIFDNDSTDVEVNKLTAFRIEPGPESENDKYLAYQAFMVQLDSTRTTDPISYDVFVDNRSIYTSNLLTIVAESSKKDIFKDLESGISSAFSNAFSNAKKIKEEKLYALQRDNIQENLNEVDSLQRVYINLLREEAERPNQEVKLGALSLSPERSSTREYELLEKEIALRADLQEIEEKIISKDVFVDVISTFQSIGNRVNKISEKYTIIFPLAAFVFLCLGFVINRVVIFVNNYKE